MPVIIENIGGNPNGKSNYLLRVNENKIANFKHHRPDGLVECLKKAYKAAQKIEAETRGEFKNSRMEQVMIDRIDLMRDEFVRILAIPDATDEIRQICTRAIAEIDQHVPVITQRDEALAEVRRLREHIDPTRVYEHPRFHIFIRAFWRRISPYKHIHGKELPDVMPVEFICCMATAFLVFESNDSDVRQEDRFRIANGETTI